MQVNFHAPTVGRTSVPLGLDGPGEASWTANGIALKGLRHNPSIGSVFGLLGFLLGVAAAAVVAVIQSKLGFTSTGGGKSGAIFPAAAFLGTIFATMKVGRGMVKPKEISFTVPWEKVKKLGIEPDTGLVAFVSKGEFTGQVQLSVEGRPAAEVLEELKRVGSLAGLKT